MAVKGAKYARIAFLTADGTVDVEKGTKLGGDSNGVIKLDADSVLGISEGDVSLGLSAGSARYGSNQVIMLTPSTPSPSIKLGALGIPEALSAALLGLDDNGDGSYSLDDDTPANAPDVAIEFVATSVKSEKDVHFCLPRTNVTGGDVNAKTNDKNTQYADDSFTFTALTKQGSNEIARIYNEADPNYDESKLLSTVFPQAGATTTTTIA